MQPDAVFSHAMTIMHEVCGWEDEEKRVGSNFAACMWIYTKGVLTRRQIPTPEMEMCLKRRMMSIMLCMNWVCAGTFDDQEWVSESTIAQHVEEVVGMELDCKIGFPCVVQWGLLWSSAPTRLNRTLEKQDFGKTKSTTKRSTWRPVRLPHRIVRRTTRSFTFKDGVFSVIDDLWASRQASVCTRRNCPSLHDMARHFYGPPRTGLRQWECLPLESASLPTQLLPPRLHHACSSLFSVVLQILVQQNPAATPQGLWIHKHKDRIEHSHHRVAREKHESTTGSQEEHKINNIVKTRKQKPDEHE